MKKGLINFIGIDVSKNTLDVALIKVIKEVKRPIISFVISNTRAGLKQLEVILKGHSVIMNEQTLLVIENTGMYHRLLFNFCVSEDVSICIENAAQIKWSLGISRGKNDKVDARRIAVYAYKNREDLEPSTMACKAILELKDLLTIREKVIKQINQLKVPINEMKNYYSKSEISRLEKNILPAINGLKASLQNIEKDISNTISSDKILKQQYQLLLSVPGIGKVTALYLLSCTRGFTSYNTGKQLASYAGVVPFEHRSGISIRGRSRVHKMANKNLKRLLHMGAVSCIKNYPEFKEYYERKQSEGKHKMSVLNAIRNKIILRVAAVIKNQQPYVSNYSKAA